MTNPYFFDLKFQEKADFLVQDCNTSANESIQKTFELYKRKLIEKADKPLSILMISDYFYPGLGGVEAHIFHLSSCLIHKGNKVVIFTHSRGTRSGVYYMNNGVKIYYYDFMIMFENCIWAEPFGAYPALREICVREQIDLIHTHQTPSTLSLQCALHASSMGIPCVFTDHSLYGFDDSGAIHLNKLLRFFLSGIGACISVSHTNKENLALRAAIHPDKIFVVPNALDPTTFKPSNLVPRGPLKNVTQVNIITISRLTYRKGIDLLCGAIPLICKRYPDNVKFIIGGEGNKMLQLEEMREFSGLHDKVVLLGRLNSAEVKKVLKMGHIFLNTSLTEAFCLGILEAACSGLFVVATEVGGMTEVLPHNVVTFAELSVNSLVDKTCKNIERVLRGELNPWKLHDDCKNFYSWFDVADRVQIVYKAAMKQPIYTISEKIQKYALSLCTSQWSIIYVFLSQWFWHVIWNIWRPVENIPIAFSINQKLMRDLNKDDL